MTPPTFTWQDQMEGSNACPLKVLSFFHIVKLPELRIEISNKPMKMAIIKWKSQDASVTIQNYSVFSIRKIFYFF